MKAIDRKLSNLNHHEGYSRKKLMKPHVVVATDNMVATRVIIQVVSVGFKNMRSARSSETMRGSWAKTTPRKHHPAARRTV